jgi:hypothetical protein
MSRGQIDVCFSRQQSASCDLASLVYGVRTFRQPRARGSTWLAAAGIVLALLVLNGFLWISISFTIDPPE